MALITFYVVPHSCGGFSVQTKAKGGGELLPSSSHPNTKEGAQIACDAANETIKLLGEILTKD
jgi:hypothetical protein